MNNRQYGKIEGLTGRLATWLERTKYDKSLPWVGLGLCHDMEVILRLFSLEEFGQWLRGHSDDELQRWGVEVLDAADAVADLDALRETIDEQIPAGVNEPYTEMVERGGAAVTENDEVRKVLTECGALAPDDTTTDVPALLRALLS